MLKLLTVLSVITSLSLMAALLVPIPRIILPLIILNWAIFLPVLQLTFGASLFKPWRLTLAKPDRQKWKIARFAGGAFILAGLLSPFGAAPQF
jgi:hypothetical protein